MLTPGWRNHRIRRIGESGLMVDILHDLTLPVFDMPKGRWTPTVGNALRTSPATMSELPAVLYKLF